MGVWWVDWLTYTGGSGMCWDRMVWLRWDVCIHDICFFICIIVYVCMCGPFFSMFIILYMWMYGSCFSICIIGIYVHVWSLLLHLYYRYICACMVPASSFVLYCMFACVIPTTWTFLPLAIYEGG